jgi:hypothetical protein
MQLILASARIVKLLHYYGKVFEFCTAKHKVSLPNIGLHL